MWLHAENSSRHFDIRGAIIIVDITSALGSMHNVHSFPKCFCRHILRQSTAASSADVKPQQANVKFYDWTSVNNVICGLHGLTWQDTICAS